MFRTQLGLVLNFSPPASAFHGDYNHAPQSLVLFSLFTFIYSLCVVCKWPRSEPMSLLLAHGFLEANSKHQVWLQMPLPTKPSHYPTIPIFFLILVLYNFYFLASFFDLWAIYFPNTCGVLRYPLDFDFCCGPRKCFVIFQSYKQ